VSYDEYEDDSGRIEVGSNGEVKATIGISGWTLQGLGDAVVKLAASMLVKAAREEVLTAARAEIDAQIKAKVGELVTEVFETPIRKTNTYGEPVGESIPMREHIVEVVRKYLAETVDRDGRTGGYGDNRQSRAQWLVSTSIAAVVDKEFKPQIDAAIASTKERLKQSVAALMTEKFSKALGVP